MKISLFFLGNFEWKTPTDICSCGCRCSFVFVRLFVPKSERAVGFKYNIVQNISPSLTGTLAHTCASGRVSGSQLDFENPDSSPGKTYSLRFLIVIFTGESEGVNQGSSCVCWSVKVCSSKDKSVCVCASQCQPHHAWGEPNNRALPHWNKVSPSLVPNRERMWR